MLAIVMVSTLMKFLTSIMTLARFMIMPILEFLSSRSLVPLFLLTKSLKAARDFKSSRLSYILWKTTM